MKKHIALLLPVLSIVACGAETGEPIGQTRQSVIVNKTPIGDTWFHQLLPGVRDYGVSCELRVATPAVPANAKSVLLFDLVPDCAGWMASANRNATLTVTSGDTLVGAPAPVNVHRVTAGWGPGPTGGGGCAGCAVASGANAAFIAPTFNPFIYATMNVNANCTAHTVNVTNLVTDWCTLGNMGLMLRGNAAGPNALTDFQSMESAAPPVLSLTY